MNATIPFQRPASRRTQLWRGVSSLLAAIVFLFGYWWRWSVKHLRTSERLERGCVFVLPGIQGKSPLEFCVARGLDEGGVNMGIVIHDWTTGLWPLCLIHLRFSWLHRWSAKRLAAKIQAYRQQYPGRPVHLVGHSGGAGVSLMALEQLPEDAKATSVVLLAPAVSPWFNLSPALRKTTHGVHHFHSLGDWLFLGFGTMIFGTLDGKHCIAAGMRGFANTSHGSPNEPALQQYPYQFSMLKSWNGSGHLGCVNRVFAANWIAPLITKTISERKQERRSDTTQPRVRRAA